MKRLLAFLLLTACFLSMMPVASANGWGLTGKLLDAVSDDHTWNDYTTICKQAGNVAVMGSRYHNALMFLEDGKLQVCTTAVYQPGEAPDKVSLKLKDGLLTLAYGKKESYTFCEGNDGYYLISADIGDFTVSGAWDGDYLRYVTRQGDAMALTGGAIYLRDFNIELFPRSVEEIRHLNLMQAALDTGTDVLGWWGWTDDLRGRRYSSIGKKTTPVYSAPYGEAAWRSGNGKAAVGLSGELWWLRYVTNADGEHYACIRYDVSERTQRIGYIPASVLGEAATGEPTENDMISVPVYARTATFLTDDPDVSQYAQVKVPKGTKLTCIGMYEDQYAYVTGEVRNGKFVSGGQIIWGFVPLRDLALDAPQRQPEAIRQDVMNTLAGCWVFEAGGSMSAEVLQLNDDGTYIAVNDYDEITGALLIREGRWYVTEYHDAWNLYWDGPDYEITMIEDGSGYVNIKGLSVDRDGNGFGLTNWEGGGGYARVTPAYLDAMELYWSWFVDVDGVVELRTEGAQSWWDWELNGEGGNG